MLSSAARHVVSVLDLSIGIKGGDVGNFLDWFILRYVRRVLPLAF